MPFSVACAATAKTKIVVSARRLPVAARTVSRDAHPRANTKHQSANNDGSQRQTFATHTMRREIDESIHGAAVAPAIASAISQVPKTELRSASRPPKPRRKKTRPLGKNPESPANKKTDHNRCRKWRPTFKPSSSNIVSTIAYELTATPPSSAAYFFIFCRTKPENENDILSRPKHSKNLCSKTALRVTWFDTWSFPRNFPLVAKSSGTNASCAQRRVAFLRQAALQAIESSRSI